VTGTLVTSAKTFEFGGTAALVGSRAFSTGVADDEAGDFGSANGDDVFICEKQPVEIKEMQSHKSTRNIPWILQHAAPFQLILSDTEMCWGLAQLCPWMSYH
jgi:hypothetical protein